MFLKSLPSRKHAIEHFGPEQIISTPKINVSRLILTGENCVHQGIKMFVLMQTTFS